MHASLVSFFLHLMTVVVGGRRRDERGDVPGWVMVTMMTAVVITVLTPIVGEQLAGLLREALDMVRNN